MWKKAITRLILVAVVVAGSLLVFAASRTAATLKSECQATGQCDDNNSKGEFIIWESLSRTVMATVR